jgi:hypothetical protein
MGERPKLPPSVTTGFLIAGVVIVGLFTYTMSLRYENMGLRARLAVLEGDAEVVPEPDESASGEADTTAAVDPVPQPPPDDETITLGSFVLGPSERATLASQLAFVESDADRRVWITVTFGDPVAAEFAIALRDVFKDAGFDAQEITIARFPIRPGIYFMAADEEPPDHVNTILGAIEATGWEVTSGRGYRAFYAEKKQEDPSWNGFEMTPDQPFVIAIGRAGEAGE